MNTMNSVELIPACYSDVVFIARRMRDLDRKEILPLIFGESAENLAAGTIAVGGISTVALFGAEPVAAFGAYQARPLFWNVWMFATDQWPRVALSVTRNILKVIRPQMIEAGAVRADCWSIDDHSVAHRWLELLGAVREATLEDYGPTRKKFHCYSWTLSRLEREANVLFPQTTVAAGNSAPAPAARTDYQGRSGSECRSGGRAAPAFGSQGPGVYDPVGNYR